MTFHFHLPLGIWYVSIPCIFKNSSNSKKCSKRNISAFSELHPDSLRSFDELITNNWNEMLLKN